jgi:hypothetical protein
MKRQQDTVREDRGGISEVENKRQRGIAPIFKLSNDEIRTIMSFMTVGETIMFALSNKTLNDTVTEVLKDYYPHTTKMPKVWSITRAFKRVRWYLAKVQEPVKVKAIKFNFNGNDDEETETEIPILPKFNKRVIKYNEISPHGIFALLSGAVFVEELNVQIHYSRFSDLKKKLQWSSKADHWYNKKYFGWKVIPVEHLSNVRQVVEAAGIKYNNGRFYYQLLEKEDITRSKKIIVINKVEQTIFSGNDALEEIGAIKQDTYTLSPHNDYHIFAEGTANQQLPIGSYVLFKCTHDNDPEEDFVIVPMLYHLKKFSITYTEDETEDYLFDILRLAPNLEELTFVYINTPDNELLKTLAKYNLKLKRLEVSGNTQSTPLESYFSDKGLLKFLSKVPLEYLRLDNSSYISGALFKQIGKYATNLKSLHICRHSYNGDFVKEAKDIYFGGGVMKNLRVIALTGWENLGDKFYKTLAKCAPNVRVFHANVESDETGFSLSVYTNIIESLDLHKLVIAIPPYKQISNKDSAAFIKAISTRQNLKKLIVQHFYRDVPFTVEELKTFTMPSLRVYQGEIDTSEEWLEAFHQAFPNLEAITNYDHILFEFLQRNENYWPNLNILDGEKEVIYGQCLSRDRWGISRDAFSEQEEYILKWMGSKKSIIQE